MNHSRSHHRHQEHHHDVHQQRLLWFFSFCNQRSSSSSTSSGGSQSSRRNSRRGKSSTNTTTSTTTNSRNKYALQYQQQLKQQQKQWRTSNVFGCDLIEHTRIYNTNTNNNDEEDFIPNIVKSCTRFIEKHGILYGIYRIAGVRMNVLKLRQDFDKNPNITMIDGDAISNDAHAVACVLKQYFRELPTPLMTFHLYEKFIELFKPTYREETTNEAIITSSYDINNSNTNASNTKNRNESNTKNEDLHNNNQEPQDQPDCIILKELKEEEPKPSTSITAETNTSSTQIASGTHQDKTGPDSHHQQAPDTTTFKMLGVDDGPNDQITNKTTTDPSTNTRTISSTTTKKTTTTVKNVVSSVSDSKLISLSSIVVTSPSNARYEVKLDELRQLLKELPKVNYQTLKYLIRHLAFMTARWHKTAMDSKNVAIVWAPNLLKPPELDLTAGLETLQLIALQAVITEQLIIHHDFLFDDEYTDFDDACSMIQE